MRIKGPRLWKRFALPFMKQVKPFAQAQDSCRMDGVRVRLDSPLAEIALLPGVDPRHCLKGPILPKGRYLNGYRTLLSGGATGLVRVGTTI